MVELAAVGTKITTEGLRGEPPPEVTCSQREQVKEGAPLGVKRGAGELLPLK